MTHPIKLFEFYTAGSIQSIPDEILIEIFKWIPFEDLHGNIVCVCRTWHKVVLSHYRYPRIVFIKNTNNKERTLCLLSKHNQRISVLKIWDFFDTALITCLKMHRWCNLKTLAIRSSRAGLALSAYELNEIIDNCPNLRCLEIRECLMSGSMETVFEKIEKRQITKFVLLNRYLVIDNIEWLYELKNMEIFKIYCHFFNRNDIVMCVDKFCTNNRHSLTRLSLHVENRGQSQNEDDVILKKVASCKQLAKLCLVGQLRISSQGVEQIAVLPKLRCLKMEVFASLTSKVFIRLLSDKFMRKLDSLGVSWHRGTKWAELDCLREYTQLRKLSLEFWNDDNDLILKYIVEVVKSSRNLRQLKLLSVDINFLPILSLLDCYENNLVYVKIRRKFRTTFGQRNTSEKNLSLISMFNFNYEYSMSENEYEIRLTKKID